MYSGNEVADQKDFSETARQNRPKNFLRMKLHYRMKMRAWGCAAKFAGGRGTSPKSVGWRSQRAQGRAVRLRCSAWPEKGHPTLEKAVGWLGTAVGAGALHWWGRFPMFPPPGAPQIARRRAVARRVIRAPALWPFDPPPLKTFFCTESLQVLRAFLSVSNTFLSDSFFLSTSI